METFNFLGNSALDWAKALCLGVSVYTLLTLSKRLTLRKIQGRKSLSALDFYGAALSVLSRTKTSFLLSISVLGATQVLAIPDRTQSFIQKFVFTVLLVQIAIWASTAIRFFVEQDSRISSDGARAQSIRALGFIATFATYLLLLLWALDTFGVNINTLIAGLGVGGIAVALAVQNILGDLFASLTIVLDKPFVYGDFITVGEFKGTIEKVGLKTTRVRSQSGEQLIFPNADLLQSRIRNYKRMQERRSIFTFYLALDSSTAQLKALPAAIQKIIQSTTCARFERAHLVRITTSGLEFEVVYWVMDPEYGIFADTQQAITLQLLELLQHENLQLSTLSDPRVAAQTPNPS
jgi:small-conductance mechanosensitive channel